MPKIIIDISERDYKKITEVNDSSLSCVIARMNLYEAVKNGTILPKGHGRLIDAGVIWDIYHSNDYDFYEALDSTPTIIEADQGE